VSKKCLYVSWDIFSFQVKVKVKVKVKLKVKVKDSWLSQKTPDFPRKRM